jgi:excisionase family DNA binding protein
MEGSELLTTVEAARELGVSPVRVRALIAARRLPARKIGPVWTIARGDLARVAIRRPGRPPVRPDGEPGP